MTCFRSLRSLLLVLFVLTVSGTQWRLAGGAERESLLSESPSILWICVDDMSDWLSCYGDPVIRTPHLDLLAEQGIRFENAFMPSPVCSTSRSALITGQMQTSLGLHHHRTMLRKPLPPDVLTLPEHLRRAGYLTFNESKDDYNFVYFEKNGSLYLNGNGAEKNWGNSSEGGLIAILKGNPVLTADDITLLA